MMMYKMELLLLLAIFVVPISGADAQWVQTSGPSGDGDIQCMAVNGNNLFAGSLTGGVYRSTNNGTSWTSVNAGLTNPIINALTIKGNDLFAATYFGGVFLSTDNGGSWTPSSTWADQSERSGICREQRLSFCGFLQRSLPLER